MDKYFNDKNINNQVNILMNSLGIKDNNETRNKCKTLIIDRLKIMFNKYKNKKPDNLSQKEFYDKINKKSLEYCIKYCEEQIAKKKNINNNDRETDIYGKRPIVYQQRGKFTSLSDNNKFVSNGNINELKGYSDDVGYYASISNNEGKVITADGRTDNRFMGNEEPKKSNEKETLEDIYNKRINEYAPNPKSKTNTNNTNNNNNNININNNNDDDFVASFNDNGFNGLNELFPELKGTLKQEGPLERVNNNDQNNNALNELFPELKGTLKQEGPLERVTNNTNNTNTNTNNTNYTNNKNNILLEIKEVVSQDRIIDNLNQGRQIVSENNNDSIKKFIQDCIKNELQMLQHNITQSLNNNIEQNIKQLIGNLHENKDKIYNTGIRYNNDINNIITKNIDKMINRNVIIKSDEQTIPQKYNNYTVKFNEPLKSINSITLLKFSIPYIEYNITPMYNKIIINNNCAQLNSGNYSVIELLNEIHNIDNDVEAVIVSDRIKIRSISGSNLILKNNVKCSDGSIIESIIDILGFKQDNYDGHNEYISDEPFNLDPPKLVNLFLNDMRTPLCMIDLEKQNMVTTNTRKCDIELLPALYIAFKRIDNNKLYDFCGKPHILEFGFS